VLADRGYDAGYIVEAVAAVGAEAVIPPRPDCREKRAYDRAPHRERNGIGRMFARLKQFRGIATRYARLAVPFMASSTWPPSCCGQNECRHTLDSFPILKNEVPNYAALVMGYTRAYRAGALDAVVGG
jgi:hypothetical protein